MMSFLDMISEPEPRARRVLLYGTHGIGKSTFGAMAPSPVFIQTEDGLRNISGVKAFPLAKNLSDVMQQIHELNTREHNFRTLVLDSVDWTERLIQQFVCQEGGKSSIAEFGFGKGYDLVASLFADMLQGLAELNTNRYMLIILLAHCQVERFENPQTEAYDRYAPKVHKKINGTLQEWCDEVLFANYKVYTKTEEGGFGKERKLGIGSGDRVIYTTERPSHLAKNRIEDCPQELPLAFSAYWDLIKPRQPAEAAA